MKFLSLLPLAALSTAFVIPDEQVFNLEHVPYENHPASSGLDKLPSLSDLKDELQRAEDRLREVGEEVKAVASNVNERIHETYFDVQGWLEQETPSVDDVTSFFDHHDHPHDPEHDHPHGPHDPDHDHPHDPHHDHPPHDGPPHRRPGHGPPHKSNLTLYQLISESKYTTKLAKLISEYPEFVESLNSTEGHFTIFAPTDRAFEKIPEHAPKPSKEQLKALLEYHMSPEFYPAGRVLVTRTIPTLLHEERLGGRPQRLSTHVGPNGLNVNFYSRIVAVDIFGANGVIHGVDSILVPPPSTVAIIDLLPSEFSTLELGLGKTGLLEEYNKTDNPAGTLFAPSNFAFQKLGPKINAFLFSKFGLKYLRALLEYHIVPQQVLYSDAFYRPGDDNNSTIFAREAGRPRHGVPKGFFHVDLPTLLEDKSLSINIFRYGRLIEIKINGFSRVDISDGVASNGVIHVVSDVLIPPKQLNGASEEQDDQEMTLEEFKERLEPYVQEEESNWFDL